MIVGITGAKRKSLSSVIGNTLSSTLTKETIKMKYVHTDDILMNKGRFWFRPRQSKSL